MSHFTVLVIGDNPEKQLAPFQENNMGDCPKEFLKFVDIEEEYLQQYQIDTTTKVVMPDWRLLNTWDDEFRVAGIGFGSHTHQVPSHLEKREVKLCEIYQSFENYMKDWCGHESRDAETGKFGYWENPNKKWDWYVLGGRWSGLIKLKEDAKGTIGKAGVFGNQTGVDQALVKDISNLEELITFAVIKDGQWHQRGEMGWWGVVLNEKAKNEWDDELKKLLNGLDGETLISIYDCHI